jgi:hypothetical protein
MPVKQELTRTEAAALSFAAKAAASKDNESAAWFARTANRKAKEAGTTVEALLVKAAAIEAAVVEAPAALVAPAAPTCSVKAIRRFFAICKSAGVDISRDDRMKGALSAFLGRKVASRKELSTDDWLRAGDAIERAALVF